MKTGIVLAFLSLPASAQSNSLPAACAKNWANDVRKSMDSVRALHLKYRGDIAQVQSQKLNEGIEGVLKVCSDLANAQSSLAIAAPSSNVTSVKQCEALVAVADGYSAAASTYETLSKTNDKLWANHSNRIRELEDWNDQEVYAKRTDTDARAGSPGIWQKVRAEVKLIYGKARSIVPSGKKGAQGGLVKKGSAPNVFDSYKGTPFEKTMNAYGELSTYFLLKENDLNRNLWLTSRTINKVGSLCTAAQADHVQNMAEKSGSDPCTVIDGALDVYCPKD